MSNKIPLTSEEIRQKFIDFWKSEPRNAKEVENVSLVPNNDPTLLFVNSGMFPLVPYLGGQPHPLGTRLFNAQRCVRTIDIDEVGDYSHLTLFEMVGNWSLGDFTKAEQIPWMFELYVDHFGLDPKRCYVSVWGGDDTVARDDEAIEIWKKVFRKYGIEAEYSEDITNIPSNIEEGNDWKFRIFPYGKKDNWWQRGPNTPGELGGPTSELFYDLGNVQYKEDEYHINDDSGRFLEVGNSVFMEYQFGEDNVWHEMSQKNIDFGGGFERIVVAVQDRNSIYETDVMSEYLTKIEELSGKKYNPKGDKEMVKSFRIVAEHARAATFILGDGVRPANKDQGYILRRLIRRMIRHAMNLGIESNFARELSLVVIDKMAHKSDAYPILAENSEFILSEIEAEEQKFRKTLTKGIKELRKMVESKEELDGKKAFYVYETYGFPLEMTLEEFTLSEGEIGKITAEFNAEQEKHKAQSRSGSEKKFSGGLADNSETTTRLHSAHHILLAAIQEEFGKEVKQRGSNITSERLRIDFSLDHGLNEDQRAKIESRVNEIISADMPMIRVELSKKIAEKIGAEMEFGQKYPERVTVYVIADFNDEEIEALTSKDVSDEQKAEIIEKKEVFSKEFCGGPHVKRTGELAESGQFKIKSEKSNGSGVRRIKALLE